MQPVDISGKTFGYLNVLRPSRVDSNRKVRWVCRCSCGREIEVVGSSLRNGNTKSCGCQKGEMCKVVNTTHGKSLTPTHITWKNMLARCSNPNNTEWENYGGRGITVCERWHTFANFLADMGEKPEGLTVDRIEVNGNYEPSNCRWATWKEQSANKRVATNCKRGHAYTEGNLYFSSGRRHCRMCVLLRSRALAKKPRFAKWFKDGL